jgi:hypothetical protein
MPGIARLGPSFRDTDSTGENFLQFVRRVATEAPRHGAQQIEIHGALRLPVGRPCIHHVLGAACEAFHRDEVFAPDDPEIHTQEGHFHRAGKDFRIHPAEPAQQLDLIAVSVPQYEHRRNGVVRISATQLRLEARTFECGAQAGQPAWWREKQGIHVHGAADLAVYRKRKGANDGVVHFLTLQDPDDVEEQERGLTRLPGPHGFCSVLRSRPASAARPA